MSSAGSVASKLEKRHVGRRFVPRKRLGLMMSSWGGDFSYGRGTGAVGAVASFYHSDKPYPDKGIVREALQEVERLEPLAMHGAHGWTPKDARELRNIAGGLKYYLKADY